jgi:hypothetical protein
MPTLLFLLACLPDDDDVVVDGNPITAWALASWDWEKAVHR